jgi:hypothetical protein
MVASAQWFAALAAGFLHFAFAVALTADGVFVALAAGYAAVRGSRRVAVAVAGGALDEH